MTFLGCPKSLGLLHNEAKRKIFSLLSEYSRNANHGPRQAIFYDDLHGPLVEERWMCGLINKAAPFGRPIFLSEGRYAVMQSQQSTNVETRQAT
jgi:hypothetical protein